ncbi:helix-turn-helix domain-containing protein [Corynebacterium kutscheri]|uniref:Aerobic repressor of nitrate reductase R n=1 Tax=Corynebacterium kutscheri TaxID=35755 RepID=A0AB38VTT4_9CORY|nr:helix-turn-helix domain-containing protein [Corynebacterium kutscheri]VEH08927.1 Aerobic repressor of nitrate reductase R [Corynebacterium kutscheri]
MSDSDHIPRPATDFFVESFNLSTRKRHVLDVITNHPSGITATEVAKKMGIHINTARGHLEELSHLKAIDATPLPANRRGRPTLLFKPRILNNRMLAAELINLIQLLIKEIEDTNSEEAVTIAQRVGVNWAKQLRINGFEPAPEEIIDQIDELFRRLGFLPDTHDRMLDVSSCPSSDDKNNPSSFICYIHRGMLQEFFHDVSLEFALPSYHGDNTCQMLEDPASKEDCEDDEETVKE